MLVFINYWIEKCTVKHWNLSYPFLGAFAQFLKATIRFVMFVCLSVYMSAWSNSALTGRICMKFDVGGFLEILSRKFKFDENLRKVTGTLHEELCTLIITSRWIILGISVLSDKVVEKIKTHCILNNIFPKIVPFMRYVEYHVTVRQATDDNIILCMRFACWVTEAAGTPS